MDPLSIFLRGVWTFIRDYEDASWVNEIATTQKKRGLVTTDQQDVIKRMLDAGVSQQDIARLCRIAGCEAALGILYHLEDPHSSYAGFNDEAPDLHWRVQVLDGKTDEPVTLLDGLNENFAAMDPTGREMEPPSGT
jgi:hypothetical protein